MDFKEKNIWLKKKVESFNEYPNNSENILSYGGLYTFFFILQKLSFS